MLAFVRSRFGQELLYFYKQTFISLNLRKLKISSLANRNSKSAFKATLLMNNTNICCFGLFHYADNSVEIPLLKKKHEFGGKVRKIANMFLKVR